MNRKKRYPLLTYGINLLKVKAVVGGTPKGNFGRVTLLIDTGSSFTILPIKLLEELGYEINYPLRRQLIITGKGNTPPLPIVTVSWFNCVGQSLENFEIVAYNIPASLQVDGLLGMNFLLQCQAVISLAKAEIYFELV